MADNFVVSTPGGVRPILADEIGTDGPLAQGVKLVFGADGVAAYANDTAPFPIKIASQGSYLPDVALSMFKRVSTADTNAAVIKATAGKLYGVQASNVNTAVRYLKLYNKATAPTVGTDVPVKTIAIPGGGTAGGVRNVEIVGGADFTAGIAMALTTEATDAGTTAVAASEIVVNIDYK